MHSQQYTGSKKPISGVVLMILVVLISSLAYKRRESFTKLKSESKPALRQLVEEEIPTETSSVQEQPRHQLEPGIKPYQPKVVQTDDWKLYRNRRFGYTIDYPRSWIAREVEKDEDYEMVEFLSGERRITLMTYANPDRMISREFFTASNSQPDFFSQSHGYSYGKISGRDHFIFEPYMIFVPMKVGIINSGAFFVEIYHEGIYKDSIFDSMIMNFEFVD